MWIINLKVVNAMNTTDRAKLNFSEETRRNDVVCMHLKMLMIGKHCSGKALRIFLKLLTQKNHK